MAVLADRTYLLSLALAAQVCASFPAAAQDGDVAAFLSEAMTLCIQNYRDPNALVQELDARGYSYTPEQMGPDETIHWFTPPQGADLGSVMITYEDFSLFCAIGTDRMGVTEMVPFTGEFLEQSFPGLFSFGTHENRPVVTPGSSANDACTGYAALLPQSATEISIGGNGQDPVCVENGTGQIMMSF